MLSFLCNNLGIKYKNHMTHKKHNIVRKLKKDTVLNDFIYSKCRVLFNKLAQNNVYALCCRKCYYCTLHFTNIIILRTYMYNKYFRNKVRVMETFTTHYKHIMHDFTSIIHISMTKFAMFNDS